MTLKSELAALYERFKSNTDAGIREAMARADIDLAASGLTSRALGAGDRAPDFTLPSVCEGPVRLAGLLKDGPVVLSFFRGGWCPFCTLELQALQTAFPHIAAMGASLVAISPQKPDFSRSTAEANALTYPLLSDEGSAVATAFGVTFELPTYLRAVYESLGHDLPTVNGDGAWLLPVPATFVIDSDGIIAMSFIDIDFRNRLEPDDILAVLACLARRANAA
jgi:peroxiredoxin